MFERLTRIPTPRAWLSAACGALVAIATAIPAEAHGPRVHGPRVGISVRVGPPPVPYYHAPRVYPRYRYWGAPLVVGPGVYYGAYGAPAWGPSYYEAIPPVAESPTYVERAPITESVAPPASPGNWYWCSQPEGYYPYVRECAAGWQPVPAQPPSQ